MTDVPLTFDGLREYLKSAPPAKVQELTKMAQPYLGKGWLPQAGPQYEAYHSKADELLYGGAAGGGKTDLLLGLATTAHSQSLLFRRQSTDLDGLWGRLGQIAAGRIAQQNEVKKTMRLTDGRTIEGGHLEKPGSEKSWQGRPHTLIGVDEGAQMDEFKIAFVIQWLRSVERERCRLVIATNPPLPEIKDGKLLDFGTGEWLKRWFAPWLDPTYPLPAKSGELRWCYMDSQGDRLVSHWVEGPGYYWRETGERAEPGSFTDDDRTGGRVVAAKSRTFIRSLLKDNAYLADTDYADRLSSTPEPMRSMLMEGRFDVKLEDNPMQVIPTAWVLEAQARWNARQHEIPRLRQIVLGCDVAQGGQDNATYVPLLEDNVFGEITAVSGRETPDGLAVAAQVLSMRRDGSLIVLDGGGGWAGDAYRTLETQHGILAELFVPSRASGGATADQAYLFENLRAHIWWRFREALNPKSGEFIALPPNPRLLAQLTAPVWFVRGKRMLIESKDDLRARIGSSTDEADAVLMAWHYRDMAAKRIVEGQADIVRAFNDPNYQPHKPGQSAHDPVDLDDILGGW